MTCERASSIPMQTDPSEYQLHCYLNSQQIFSAKTVVTVNQIREVKHWIINNIGRSQKHWSITDYQRNEFDWRVVAGAVKSKTELSKLPLTIIVNFSKREDLMKYLLNWPGELLINE